MTHVLELKMSWRSSREPHLRVAGLRWGIVTSAQAPQASTFTDGDLRTDPEWQRLCLRRLILTLCAIPLKTLSCDFTLDTY
jgi:hypothetical protein